MINFLIKDRMRGWLFIMAVYACSVNNVKNKLWDALREINEINKFPWIIAKDFNEVGSSWENSGGLTFNQWFDRFGCCGAKFT